MTNCRVFVHIVVTVDIQIGGGTQWNVLTLYYIFHLISSPRLHQLLQYADCVSSVSCLSFNLTHILLVIAANPSPHTSLLLRTYTDPPCEFSSSMHLFSQFLFHILICRFFTSFAHTLAHASTHASADAPTHTATDPSCELQICS